MFFSAFLFVICFVEGVFSRLKNIIIVVFDGLHYITVDFNMVGGFVLNNLSACKFFWKCYKEIVINLNAVIRDDKEGVW